MAAYAQQKNQGVRTGTWRAHLHRQDSVLVQFNLETKWVRGKLQMFIINATEKIALDNVIMKGDSLLFALPVFESEFRTRLQKDGTLKGTWYKGTALQTQQWLFTAVPGKSTRFDLRNGNAAKNITGKWAMSIARSAGGARPAVADLIQKGNRVTGTVLTPSGDYRYMEGVVSGTSFELSVFDGAHAFYFLGEVEDTAHMNGKFYSGFAGVEQWKAEKNDRAVLPDIGNVPKVKDGNAWLDFSFRDLDRNLVSIKDKRYTNKVVIIQLMGSWCPNCMDETRFLSDYYNRNKGRGVEVLALAYEYSTDYERSRASLDKFRKLYKVEYPMLITGVWINDSLRTEKTLPQITPIRAFPTTIFVGKDGKIKKIEAGFSGPGTGIHHEAYRKEFEHLMENLLRQ